MGRKGVQKTDCFSFLLDLGETIVWVSIRRGTWGLSDAHRFVE
jgi:hypothetical protein